MALEGTLNDMPLIDLMHVFQSGRKTGRLLLSQSPYKAMLWFLDGAIINAVVLAQSTNAPIHAGEEAVFTLLHWEDGVFKFLHPQPPESYQIHITHSTDWLIIEGLRRHEQQSRLPACPRITGSTALRLVPRLAGEETQISLTLDDWRVLSQLVLETTVDEVVGAIGLSFDQTIGIINRLLALNLVEIRADMVLPEAKPLIMLPSPTDANKLVPQQRMRSLVQSIKDRLRRVAV